MQLLSKFPADAFAVNTARLSQLPNIRRRLVMAAAACAAWPMPTPAQEVQRLPWPRRRATPALQLPLLDGRLWSLAAHKGQPVLLNFWASWCEPCRAEMPALEQLAARYEPQGLQLVAINYREAEPVVRRFVQTMALQLPVLRDADGAVAQAFGVHIFPGTVGINRQGQAVFSVVGECDWSSAQASRWVSEL